MKDDKLIQYYNDRASEYEQIYFREVPERREELRQMGEYLREFATGKDVLDLCCGTGYWTAIMGQTARSIVASDVSFEMLEEARKKEYACPTVFMQADLFDLPFLAESFDLITLGYWYSHHSCDDYETLYDILRAPLRAGAKIWMCDNNPPAEGAKTDSVGKDERGNNIKARWTSEGREYHIIKNYFSEKQLRELIEPHFAIETFVFKPYYWWMVLGER